MCVCVCGGGREGGGVCLISAASAERGSNSNRTCPLGTPSNSSTKSVALYNGYYTALRPTKTEMASL